jgi:hypothetical protein
MYIYICLRFDWVEECHWDGVFVLLAFWEVEVGTNNWNTYRIILFCSSWFFIVCV